MRDASRAVGPRERGREQDVLHRGARDVIAPVNGVHARHRRAPALAIFSPLEEIREQRVRVVEAHHRVVHGFAGAADEQRRRRRLRDAVDGEQLEYPPLDAERRRHRMEDAIAIALGIEPCELFLCGASKEPADPLLERRVPFDEQREYLGERRKPWICRAREASSASSSRGKSDRAPGAPPRLQARGARPGPPGQHGKSRSRPSALGNDSSASRARVQR